MRKLKNSFFTEFKRCERLGEETTFYGGIKREIARTPEAKSYFATCNEKF